MGNRRINFFSVTNRSDMAFQIFIGGRGIGKTYSALDEAHGLSLSGEKFLLLRCSERELVSIGKPIGNPFKSLNRDKGYTVEVKTASKDGIGQFMENNNTIGYCSALSTFANLRGIDLTDVSLTIFDEFIRESHLFNFKGMGKAFLHFYETVNRNRELVGRPPMKVYFLSNSISINSDILQSIMAIKPIVNMLGKGQSRYTDRERGLYIEIIPRHEVSNEKANTALYRLTKGSDFSEQALDNKFTNDNLEYCKNFPINEFTPMLQISGITVCKHKSNGSYFVTSEKIKCKTTLQDYELDKFRLIFKPTYNIQSSLGNIFYNNYNTQLLFNALIN